MVAPRLGSTYVSASDACCACGALQTAAAAVSHPGALFDLDTRTNPLAACGWDSCTRGVLWGATTAPPTEFCSTWGVGPAPASGRCLSRCDE